LVKDNRVGTLIGYCRGKLDILINSDVKPIVVFDGNRLSMKSDVEDQRRKNRDEARKKAEFYLKNGDLEKAQRMFVQAVDITPDMAHSFMKVLKK
jgi:exonuclease-1